MQRVGADRASPGCPGSCRPFGEDAESVGIGDGLDRLAIDKRLAHRERETRRLRTNLVMLARRACPVAAASPDSVRTLPKEAPDK